MKFIYFPLMLYVSFTYCFLSSRPIYNSILTLFALSDQIELFTFIQSYSGVACKFYATISKETADTELGRFTD